MPTSTPYTYLPLPTSRHIRLLEFPGYTDQNEPLEGTLCVVDIEEATVPYVALSYTWGQPKFSEDLLLDGNGVFRITRTLAAALRRFRYTSALRWIWVDAICIDQQDDAEKTMQIPLMKDIYRGASRVMVWLGDRGQDSDLLHQIKRLVGRVIGPHEDDAVATSLVTGLSQLGRLPWFTRRWIIQELALNSNAVLCCGQAELPWPHLAPAFQLISDKNTADLQNLRLLWDLWRDIAMPVGTQNKDPGRELLGKRDIAALMISCSAFECLDGRDLIAALLGLSTDARTSVTVNYAGTVEQTFISFAEVLARSGHMAWLINQSLQRKRSPINQDHTLPSWVPDWRSAITRHEQTSKLDTEVYKRIPCDIQLRSTTPRLHLLTAKFANLKEKVTALSRYLRKSQAPVDSSVQVPINMNPAPLQVMWKSVLFPKEADLVERLTLTLVDLWPWIEAHLSEHETASRPTIWFELLMRLSFTQSHSKICLVEDYNDKARIIPDFGQDSNDLQKLRSYINTWVKHTSLDLTWEAKTDVMRVDCFLLCRQTSQSDTLTRGLPCAIGSLQSAFYHTVEIGDKVLLADLGHFRFFDVGVSSAVYDCRHIVREHAAVDESGLPLLSGVKGSDSRRSANECASLDELSGVARTHGSEDIASPVVYEFVAPCDLFCLFLWDQQFIFDFTTYPDGLSSHEYIPDDAIGPGSEVLSIWVQ